MIKEAKVKQNQNGIPDLELKIGSPSIKDLKKPTSIMVEEKDGYLSKLKKLSEDNTIDEYVREIYKAHLLEFYMERLFIGLEPFVDAKKAKILTYVLSGAIDGNFEIKVTKGKISVFDRGEENV